MIRLAVFALVITVAAGGGLVVWLLTEPGYRARLRRREVVLDDEIQQAARDNYRLLARSVRLHQQVLDADAVMPFLSAAQRRDLLAVVSEFNNTPVKGSQ